MEHGFHVGNHGINVGLIGICGLIYRRRLCPDLLIVVFKRVCSCSGVIGGLGKFGLLVNPLIIFWAKAMLSDSVRKNYLKIK